MGQFYRKPGRKCPVTHKTMFKGEAQANKAKFRIWSHDPQANIMDLHSYLCPDCGTWHIGHVSYYQKTLQGISVMKVEK